MLQIDLEEGERTDGLTDQQVNLLFYYLSLTEYYLSVSYRKLNDSDKALHYIEKSVFHAKQMKEGELRVRRVFQMLNGLGDICHNIGKLAGSKAFMEEAYMHVS
jgi:tetratricopeptide (TPR) repeat protein